MAEQARAVQRSRSPCQAAAGAATGGDGDRSIPPASPLLSLACVVGEGWARLVCLGEKQEGWNCQVCVKCGEQRRVPVAREGRAKQPQGHGVVGGGAQPPEPGWDMEPQVRGWGLSQCPMGIVLTEKGRKGEGGWRNGGRFFLVEP